jgi:transposase
LTELNAAIRELVDQLNDRVTRHLGASRKALFEELERPALKPLPAEPYTYAQWKECKLGLDYHVEVEKHYYSVPYQLLREKMWVRITARTVEVFHRGKRVAAHVRSSAYSDEVGHPFWSNPAGHSADAGHPGWHALVSTCSSVHLAGSASSF